MRSKRKLIERFIRQNLPNIEQQEDIPEEFKSFWEEQRQIALSEISIDERLNVQGLEKLIGDYLLRKNLR